MRKAVLLVPALIAVVGLSQASAGTHASLLAAPTALEAATATPEAATTFKAKPILHRPNYTYYKGDKKRRGFFRFLSFGK